MSAIYISPIAAATFNSSKLKKIEKPSEILAKRSDFCGDFYRGKSVSWASKRKKENIIMNGCESIRFGTSNEGFEVFEQEAFVDGSLKVADGRLEATLNSLSKWLVSALFAAVILWRHDAEALWGAMGAILNGFLSVALKKILNQERPVSILRSDPGMPSSHAQAIFYTVTFLSLSMVEWYGMSALTTTLSGFLFVLGSYFGFFGYPENFKSRGCGFPNNFIRLSRSSLGLLSDRLSPFSGSGRGKLSY
ncbi:hypothetical protein OROHE_000596 [Orobanche hederae]